MHQRIRTLLQLLPVLGTWGVVRLALHKLAGSGLVALRVRGVPVPLFARMNNSDLSVLYQIFTLQECAVKLAKDPQLIVDGGANVGYASVFLAVRYPRATILAVEPSAENCRVLEQNAKAFSNIKIITGAIWHSHTTLAISDPDERGWMIRVEEASPGANNSIPAFTIGELIAQGGDRELDILKLDIEGAETDLFSKGDRSWIDRIGCLIVEVHGPAARAAVEGAMSQRGFQCETSGEKLVFLRSSAPSPVSQSE